MKWLFSIIIVIFLVSCEETSVVDIPSREIFDQHFSPIEFKGEIRYIELSSGDNQEFYNHVFDSTGHEYIIPTKAIGWSPKEMVTIKIISKSEIYIDGMKAMVLSMGHH
jgi:hypothetical protein